MPDTRPMLTGDASNDQPFFIDIFAGCGGLSLGLMRAGFTGLFAVERDVNAFGTLSQNLIESDIENRFQWPSWLPKSPHSVSELIETHGPQLRALQGKVALLAGGPPCQGFSSAGKRDPNDPRNRLMNDYLSFVDHVKPKMVIVENVRGMKDDFKDDAQPGSVINYAALLVEKLSNDYVVNTKIIDVSGFGVPQRRKRFIVIGIRKDLAALKTFDPFASLERMRHSFLQAKELFSVPVSTKEAISDLEVKRNGTMESRDSVGYNDIKYKTPITSYQRLMRVGAEGIPSDTRLARHTEEVKTRFANIIDVCHADGRLNLSISPELRSSYGLKKRVIRVADPDAPSPTVTSMPDDLIHYSEPRILTVRENARLQSFPDWFSFHGKYTTGGARRRTEVPRFTQVANAVPPLFAEALGLTLKAALLPAGELEVTKAVRIALPDSRDGRSVRA